MSAEPFPSESGNRSPPTVKKPGAFRHFDPAHDILRRAEPHPLDVFFKPQTVAVIGASETPGSVGRTLLWNLFSSPFGGTLSGESEADQRSRHQGVPERRRPARTAELAVIATPAVTVPGVIRECVDAGVQRRHHHFCRIQGMRSEPASGWKRRPWRRPRRGGMRLIGPNCMGVMSPLTGFNATFASAMALPGNVAFISQSGALCTAILDWSLREMVGFSAFVSVGSMADVGWGDLIDYFGDDPHTRSIILYMETIGDPRSFLSAARQVALSKPIILIKGGRTEAAAKAAASHTGAMTGSDEVLDAALRRCGVLRVDSISSLFYMAEVLAKQPRPEGPRLAIVTNAGGPACSPPTP